jgi:hypothetical protein
VKVLPLHVRLSNDLAIETDPGGRAELLARLAGHLARVGEFDQANLVLGDLRKAFADGRNGRATVWMMLAEGLVQLFLEEQDKALDRIKRSQALGLAMQYPAIVAAASAWKAHIELSRTDLSAMAQSLRIAFDNVDAEDHDTHTRLAMVLFNSFMTCGNRAEAQKWFLCAHDRAVRNGDQASIEGLLYNRATFGLAYLRAENCFGEVALDDLSFVRLEMESARNLQLLVRGTTFLNQIDLWLARLLILEKRYPEAIEKLEHVRSTSPFAENNFSQSFVDLEVGFCKSNIARETDSQDALLTLNNESFEHLQVDERLVAEWMRWRILRGKSDLSGSDEQGQRLKEVCKEYLDMKSEVSTALTEFLGR